MNEKLKEIRDRSTEDLQRDLVDRRRHLFDLRSQAVTVKLEDPTQIGKTRKHIARIHTILRQREIASAKATATQAPAAETTKA